MTHDNVILTPASVARILGLSVSRIVQLDREGKLPALRDSGGRRLYRPADVEAYRRARAANSGETVSAGRARAEVQE